MPNVKIGYIHVLKQKFNFKSKFVLPISIIEKKQTSFIELSFIDIKTGDILERLQCSLQWFIKNSTTLGDWNENKNSIYDKLEKKLIN